MSSEEAHSRLGASGAKRWMTCPASVALSVDIPPLPTSVYAEEGTQAHELAEAILHGTTVCPEGVSESMWEYVHSYTDYIEDIIEPMFKGSSDEECIPMLIEEKVHIDWIHADLWGTADCIIFDEANSHMHVFDLKYGEGIMVDAEENPQLLFYATGAFMKFMPQTITSYIIQPRANSGDTVKSWTYGVERIHQFENELRDAAYSVGYWLEVVNTPQAVKLGSHAVKPGDHCQFCPAHSICPKHLETFTNMVETQEHDITGYDDAFMVRVVEAEKEMVPWFKSIKKILESRLLQGESIDGVKLVQKKKNRAWIDEEKVIKKFGKRTITVSKTLSPAQAEKALGKDAVAKYIMKPEGEPTLALTSDKRKAIQAPALTNFFDTTKETT